MRGSSARRRRPTLAALSVITALAAVTLTGCGGTADGSAGGRPTVVTAFYPLQFVAERLADGAFDVTTLTRPGVEPHDLELSPQALRTVASGDLVVYLGGFQPAVDEAVDQAAGDSALDVSDAADLVPVGDQGRDPHFWLDPIRLAAVADAVADRLTALSPSDAQQVRANAAELRTDLETLDAELRDGLATCADRHLVTAHEAFRYLADRYDLEQVGIAGVSPDQEPSPGDLASLARLVRAEGVRTVFTESLVSPAVARTVADSAGARTAVLDPVEGITDDSAGADYLAVMRANLRALREGLPCR